MLEDLGVLESVETLLLSQRIVANVKKVRWKTTYLKIFNFEGKCIAFESHMAELRDCLDHDFPQSSGPAALIVESIQV